MDYPPLSAQEWSKHRDLITDLYGRQRWKLKKLRIHMEQQHQFYANERMYKGRFKKWNIHRNSKLADMVAIARVLQEHGLDDRTGRKCIIEKDGKPFDMTRFWNYLRKKKWKLENLLQDPSTSTSNIVLKGIGTTRPLTPDSQDWEQSSREDTDGPSPLFSVDMSRKSSVVTEVDGSQQSNLEEPHTHFAHAMDQTTDLYGAAIPPRNRRGSASCNENPIVIRAPQREFITPLPSAGRLPQAQDMYQAKTTSMPLGMEGFISSMMDDVGDVSEPSNQLNMFWQMSQLPAHVVRIDTTPVAGDRGGNIVENSECNPTWWIARCFLASIMLTNGQVDDAEHEIQKTSAIFEELVRIDDSALLASIPLVHSILACRDMNDLAERLLKEAKSAAIYASGHESAIAQILTCLVDMHFKSNLNDDQRPETRGTSSSSFPTFFAACEKLREKYGPKHPHFITAGYWFAWRLTQEERYYEEALARFNGLIDIAEEVLKPHHILTTSILTTKARVLLSLGRPEEAVHTMNGAMDRIKERFDKRHPWRLEARRRQAVMLQKITRDQLNQIKPAEGVEEILFEVAAGRKAVLGPEHPFTKASVTNLRKFLEREDQMARLDHLLAKLEGLKEPLQMETIVY